MDCTEAFHREQVEQLMSGAHVSDEVYESTLKMLGRLQLARVRDSQDGAVEC